MKIFTCVFSVVCIIASLIYVNQGDAAHTAFWAGLAVYNYISSVHIDLKERLEKKE